jgi:hypothetical protein
MHSLAKPSNPEKEGIGFIDLSSEGISFVLFLPVVWNLPKNDVLTHFALGQFAKNRAARLQSTAPDSYNMSWAGFAQL